MRKIKEMSESISMPKGYESEDIQSDCREHDEQKRERLSRIQGYGSLYDGDEDDVGGFIPRNNVRERL